VGGRHSEIEAERERGRESVHARECVRELKRESRRGRVGGCWCAWSDSSFVLHESIYSVFCCSALQCVAVCCSMVCMLRVYFV